MNSLIMCISSLEHGYYLPAADSRVTLRTNFELPSFLLVSFDADILLRMLGKEIDYSKNRFERIQGPGIPGDRG